MLDLSPTKLLIILVVGTILIGPKRLPVVARQVGGFWRRMKDTHGAMDKELRASIPDLPASREIMRYARSPISLLDRLSQMDDASPRAGSEPQVADLGHAADATDFRAADGVVKAPPGDAAALAAVIGSTAKASPLAPFGDPGMN